ncbi:MAG TPA: SRPBCC family protein [Cytophagaceae bacterium]|nr:SRPBCC family protein [Cytophagaceae bacterium]
MNTLTAETSITVHASPAAVWRALTTPALIKQYLMGTDVSTDWKQGSPIEYSGEYQGKKYHDKGIIKQIVPEKILQSTYWSSMQGKEDKPENYNLVTYELQQTGDNTLLTLTQDNIASENEKAHSTQNWKMVLSKLKEVVEHVH